MSRIVNLMAADSFFNRKMSLRYRNRVEKERFTLTPKQAYDKLYYENVVKKSVKPSTSGVEFDQWQIDLANRLFGE